MGFCLKVLIRKKRQPRAFEKSFFLMSHWKRINNNFSWTLTAWRQVYGNNTSHSKLHFFCKRNKKNCTGATHLCFLLLFLEWYFLHLENRQDQHKSWARIMWVNVLWLPYRKCHREGGIFIFLAILSEIPAVWITDTEWFLLSILVNAVSWNNHAILYINKRVIYPPRDQQNRGLKINYFIWQELFTWS